MGRHPGITAGPITPRRTREAMFTLVPILVHGKDTPAGTSAMGMGTIPTGTGTAGVRRLGRPPGRLSRLRRHDP